MGRYSRYYLYAATTVFLSACVMQLPIKFDSQTYGAAIKENGLSFEVYAAPVKVSAMGSAAGELGSLMDIRQFKRGMPIITYLAAKSLRESLVSESGLNIDPISEALLPGGDVRQGTPVINAKGRFVIKVWTFMNTLTYQPLAVETYQYLAVVRGELLDTSNGKVLWHSVCHVGGPRDDKSLQLDKMDFKINGYKFMDIIQESAQKCAVQFNKGVRLAS
jgi:hypothetical protein